MTISLQLFFSNSKLDVSVLWLCLYFIFRRGFCLEQMADFNKEKEVVQIGKGRPERVKADRFWRSALV